MTIIYRILSFFLNLAALFLAFGLLFVFPMFIMLPAMWLPTFILVAIVLYTWFSNKFSRKVLLKQQAVKRSLYDWIRVNGFVAIIFCMLQIPAAIALMKNPEVFMEQMNQFSAKYGKEFQKGVQSSNITFIASVILLYLLALLTHVLWTFALMKKHREYFQ